MEIRRGPEGPAEGVGGSDGAGLDGSDSLSLFARRTPVEREEFKVSRISMIGR